jgi:hypothetical protein
LTEKEPYDRHRKYENCIRAYHDAVKLLDSEQMAYTEGDVEEFMKKRFPEAHIPLQHHLHRFQINNI